MLQVINFSKRYTKNKNYSARNINFSVPTGKVVGLVGSNGAGKTTIIKSIIGVLPFTEGTITVGGFDVAKQSDKAKRLILKYNILLSEQKNRKSRFPIAERKRSFST